MRYFVGTTLLIATISVAACNGEDKELVDAALPDSGAADGTGPIPDITCGAGTSGTLAAGGAVEVKGAAAKGLAGAAVAAPTGATSTKVEIKCVKGDLAPAGFRALGPTVAFSPAGGVQPVDLRITLPFLPARMSAGALTGW